MRIRKIFEQYLWHMVVVYFYAVLTHTTAYVLAEVILHTIYGGKK